MKYITMILIAILVYHLPTSLLRCLSNETLSISSKLPRYKLYEALSHRSLTMPNPSNDDKPELRACAYSSQVEGTVVVSLRRLMRRLVSLFRYVDSLVRNPQLMNNNRNVKTFARQSNELHLYLAFV